MRVWIPLAVLAVMLAAGCSNGRGVGAVSDSRGARPDSVETSIGANVFPDDPSLPRIDAAGSTPEDVLLAYVNAVNSSDWETAYSLHARGQDSSETVTTETSETPLPYEGFKVHEVRVMNADKAIVRVTYSTQGVSALDNSLKPVVVKEPGEWWVVEKSDGLWRVTSKGPWD